MDDKASDNKIPSDDATYDKSNQNTNEVQDTSNDKTKSSEDAVFQESTQGSKIGSNDVSETVQDTNRNPDDRIEPEDNRIPDSKENQKLQPEGNNSQSLNVNNNDTDIKESAQDSNTRLIDKSGMVQDSELPKNNNLNTKTNTNSDDKEN